MKKYHLLVLAQAAFADQNKSQAVIDMLGEERAFPITPQNNANVPEGYVLACQTPDAGINTARNGFTVGRWESAGIPVLGTFVVDELDSKHTWEKLGQIIAKSTTDDVRLGGKQGEEART